MKNPSVNLHKFGTVPDVQTQRSRFDRSHGWKGSFNSGDLIPILVDEGLPGDSFQLNSTVVARLTSPLKRPIMDNIRAEFFFFSVPYRLLWNNFKRFMGEQDDPGDSIAYTIPQMTIPAGGITEGSLGDYFGLPIGVAAMPLPDSLAFRGYARVWNEWFRDQNLQDSVVVDMDDGPDTLSDYTIQKRGKRYTYWTQALPWPQKGDAVEVPLGTDAPITGIGKQNTSWTTGPFAVIETDGTGTVNYAAAQDTSASTASNTFRIEEDPNNAGYPNIRADLTSATAATINEWREAFQLQRLLERDARGGTRYIEWIKSHFKVTSPDGRQQRSEYIGGGRCNINVTTVPQTSESGTTDQGFLTGYGAGQKSGIGFNTSFTEHCLVLGLVSVTADLTIASNRLDKMWTRQTREDLYIPVLANLGEQELLTQEIYCDGTGTDDDVFGYVPRWDEYRYKESVICGTFRSDAAASLDMYHVGLDYGSVPLLNAAFIQDEPPISRIIAVTAEDEFIMDIYHRYFCVRPMPTFGVPGMIDHF